MKLRKLLTFLALFVCFNLLQAQDYWSFSGVAQKGQTSKKTAEGYRTINLNPTALKNVISSQSKGVNNQTSIYLYFPNEKDVLEQFKLEPTQIIAAHVAKWAPDIKTYKGVSTEREGVSIRTTISSRGVNYIMRVGDELMFMEYQKKSNEHLYYKRGDVSIDKSFFECGVENNLFEQRKNIKETKVSSQARVTSDQTLRTYRIAITGSATYTAHWGTQADAYNAVVNTVSRINEVFETDLGVTFTLVSTESLMLNDLSVNPLRIGDNSGGNEGTNVLQGIASTISSTLDSSEYDIGHGFHKLTTADFNNNATTSFGVGPGVCGNSTWNGVSPLKAGGVSRTQLLGPTDAFDIDYVAHEIGHQFGALHTWSYGSGSGFSANQSAEPGSGSTIMGYAGTTPDDVQGNSDPYFHYVSIDQMNGYITNNFTCSTNSAISNDVPTISAGSDKSIPQGTAYYLQATSSDLNFPLYFCWEQIDTNRQVTKGNFGPSLNSGPMARSLTPTTTNVRVIPNMSRVIAGELTKTNPADVSTYPTTNDDWETVSTVSRTLNWGITIRDRSADAFTAGGQINQDDFTITVVPTPTPFAITSQATPNIIYYGGNTVTVTWDVAETNQAPINTTNVNVVMSTDGGHTYPTTLASNIVNNGTASFSMPNGINTTTARVKVEPVGNIYFAINSRNFEVRSSNTLPVGNPDTIYVFEGGTASTTSNGATSVLSNDTDADGDVLTTVLNSNVSNGNLVLAMSGTGSFTYTHDGSETTTDTFTYRANDGTNDGNLVTVSIVVTPTFDCPSVQNPISDPAAAMEDDPDDIIDFSNTFTDPDSPMLNYSINNTNPTLLSATISGTTIVLDYVDDETGTATITLTANDSSCGATVSESFVVTVTPQNDPPIANNDSITVAEGGTVFTTSTGISVINNDTDTDTASSVLTASLLTPPQHHIGSFGLTSSGTFTYIHNGSETATDSFTYNLNDGNTTVTATVNINITPVNDCPTVINATGTQNATEDDPDLVMNISNVFSDVDIYPMANTLSYSVSHTNTALATITLSSATLTIDFIDNQTGQSTVTITADDNDGCTVTDVFLLDVAAVNDSPVTITESINVDEGGTATMTTNTQTTLLANDTDIEGDTLNAIIVSTTTNGTLTLQSSGTFTYIHDGSETTTDDFQYKSNDGNSDGNTVTVNITINPINDCPSLPVGYANPYIFTTNEDQNTGTWNLRNDIIDDDHPTLTYTATHTNSALGSIILNSQQPTLFGDIAFYPNANEYGSSTGTITISDGICSYDHPVSIIVNPVNDCPTVDNPIADQTANEDAPNIVLDIRNTFSDLESATLTYSVTSNNATMVIASTTATSVILDFQPNQYGSAVIVVTASDGDSACTVDDAFTVTVSSINDAPVTVTEEISVVGGGTVTTLNDGVTTSVLTNDSDADGDSINAVLVTNPINGSLTLNANGTFSYTHNGSATTTDTFYYRSNDGYVNGNTVSVTIYINNPPVAVADTIAVLESGTATTTTSGATSVLDNDTDDPGEVLTAQIVTAPTHGTLTLNADGSFNYVHNGSDQSTDSFSYLANDGKINGAPVTVSINVTGTNDPPVANSDTIVVPLNGTATALDNGNTSVSANDIDPDGDALTVSLVSSPTYGTLTLNPGGTFSYVQNGTLNAVDTFSYKVNDGTLDSNNATVNIYLSCTPCTETIIEAGANGVSFTYQDCLCKTIRVYVPKGKAYTFCHLDGSINVSAGSYTQISSRSCN